MYSPDFYKDLCSSVVSVAVDAGKQIAAERNRFDDTKIERKGMHDLVSYVDKNSEKYIVGELTRLFPEAGFIAEEGTAAGSAKEDFNWVIDPLDGTTNFIQGIPFFAVSIALIYKNVSVLGVVYEVCREECFYAWKNGGTFLNGSPVHVSLRSNIEDALLATGFPYSNFSRIDKYVSFLKWAMENARGVRRIGSAATDLAYIACGRFDGFWEYDLKPWDVAAGAILVREAGGKVSDFEGGENFLFGREIVASNSEINSTVLHTLTRFMK